MSPRPFHWFQGKSVETLTERLIDANPATCRLEVYQDGDKMTFRVVPAFVADGVTTADEDSPINDSFLCPPRCP